MTVRSFIVICAIILFAGCTSTEVIQRGRGDQAYRSLNHDLRGQVAHVLLRDGSSIDAVGVYVDADSLIWLDQETDVMLSMPLRNVREVSVVRAGAGALRGLLIGAVSGALFGLVRAAVEGDDTALDTDPLAVTKEEKYRIYPPAHAVYASLVATPLGAILGTRQTYQFAESELDARR